MNEELILSVSQTNELLLHIYATQLWCIGVVAVIAIVYLLYKFLRKFF